MGRGPCEPELRSLAERLGVSERVRILTERIPNARIAELHSAAFACMIPSSYEIFNMTMLESLAAGTPVIARREGGMADVIRHGEVGLLYDGGGKGDIERLVAEMASDPWRYERMREAARVHVRSYGWDTLADRFISCYSRAMEEVGGA